VGPLLAPGSPLATDGTTGPRPAPALGADTAAVLTGPLGLSAADIRALAERGVIGGPADDGGPGQGGSGPAGGGPGQGTPDT
jgi:hypothetical protein